jgi:hypothetical protein
MDSFYKIYITEKNLIIEETKLSWCFWIDILMHDDQDLNPGEHVARQFLQSIPNSEFARADFLYCKYRTQGLCSAMGTRSLILICSYISYKCKFVNQICPIKHLHGI